MKPRLILPFGIRPVIQNHNGEHLAAMARLDILAGMIATLRAMPEAAFDDVAQQPAMTPGLALAVEAMGILSALMTLCSAEADQLMQDDPNHFSLDSNVAQAMPLLLWMTHGIHQTIRKSVGIPAAGTKTVIFLTQNRHTLDRVCSAVDVMMHLVRQRFPGAVPTPTSDALVH